MPLYELYRLTRERLGQESNSTRAADHSSSPDNDFCELVWENGQISSQSQSSRVRKSPSSRSLPSYCLPSNSPRARDKDVGFGTNMEKFRDFDSGLNETPMSVSSREMDLSQGEDMIPWMDFTMDGSLQHEYGSDFLNEISGVTENDLPTSINFTLLDKRSNVNQVIRDSQKNSTEQRNVSKGYLTERFEAAKPEASTSQLYPPSSHQCQTSFVCVRSRALDASHATENNNTRNENQDAPYGEISHILPSSSNFSSLKVQKQDTVMPSNGSTIMNFSHFARPAAVMKANLQNIGLRSSLSSPKLDSLDIKGKGVAATTSNPNESTLVDSSGKCPKEPTMHCEQIVEESKADLKSLQPKSLEQNVVLSKQSDHASKESPIKIDQTSSHVLGESGAKVQKIAEKSVEPAVASSSVCSGNDADGASEDPNQNLKRKSRDTEDSECHSEDVEEESVGVKKAAAGRGSTGSKRSRAAEVHNLSERRRRDRINEKMRALQELIPNCNKVDKASMLDEAIEYLKTLQLQVQMMSMGAGLYMPPMMLPAGMQHMHATHMAPFAPMGVGMHHMGFGMGYGMGMRDMNGGSSRFPMIQVPQMQGTHIPVTHMSGPAALHAMPRSNAPGFGLSGQGLPMPMPCAPAFPFSGAPLMNPSALGLHASGPAVVETMDKASASNLKDPMTNVDPQVEQSTGGHDSTSRMPTQCETTTVGLEQSTLVRNSGHASEANGSGAVNHGKEDKLVNGYD